MVIFQVQEMLEEKVKHVSKLGSTDAVEILNIQLRAGEKIPRHNAKGEVLIIVQFGEVRCEVENVENILTQNSILAMQPLENHSLEALTDASVIVLKLK